MSISTSLNLSSVSSAPASSSMDVGSLSDWLHRYDVESPRWEKISKNGSYALLEKELDKMATLIADGQAFLKGTSHYPMVLDMRDKFVKPRVILLQETYINVQKKLADNAEVKESDAKMDEKWESFNLPKEILESHMDFVRFAMDSGLIFQIVGYREAYRETCGNKEDQEHDVRFVDGQPMIKVQGSYRRWDAIKRELTYDPKTYQIRSLDYPGSIAQSWAYLFPDGLVPMDRLGNEKIVPIYRLNQEQRKRVVDCAQKFYETNPEVDQGIPKEWVVQFHTSPRRVCSSSLPPISDNPLFDNVARNLNTHITMRLIAPNGDVYSFGVEMPAESQEFLWENCLAKLFGTVPAKINKAGDYEDCKTHKERLFTNIPLSTQRAENILKFINESGDIRFNFLRQNCSNLMNIVLKMSGYEVETKTTVKECLADLLPDVKHIPVIGGVLDKINQVFKKIFSSIAAITPTPIKTVVTTLEDILLFVPRKFMTLVVNLAIRHFGGTTMMTPLPDKVEEDDFHKADRFLNFSRLMTSWTDLFKEETQELYHSKYFVEWQRKQKSTFVEPASALPKLTVAPPQ